MAVNARAVSVTTAATRLDSAEETDRPGSGISIYNNGAATVYLGGSGVTTAAGFPLAAGDYAAFDVARADALYGIVATGTVEVRVVEVGV